MLLSPKTLAVVALIVGGTLAPAIAVTPTVTAVVQLNTSIGSMTIELYGNDKPITVTNFLRYIRDGLYVNSFAHRLPQGFVLQGGAFMVDSKNSINGIPTYPAIATEAGPFPEFSNVTGTIAMALGDNPNSATGSWFLNLKDNNGTDLDNLDTNTGGFTVFGKIASGQTVLQRFANFTNYPGSGAATDTIVNLDDGALSTLPLKSYSGSGYPLVSDLIFTSWTILDGPIPVITSPSYALGTAGKAFSYQVTATNHPTTGIISSGALPAGLSFNPSTGLISGTPKSAGSTTVTIQVTGDGGAGSATLDLFIAAAPPVVLPPTVSTKAKAIGKHGKVTLKGAASDAMKVEVKPGKGAFKPAKGSPARWSFLAKGLKPGSYKFQVRATGASGQMALKTVKVLIKD
jgi:peptidyl-prolyl cis-trans isomerase A (cyclophilin A)